MLHFVNDLELDFVPFLYHVIIIIIIIIIIMLLSFYVWN